MADTPAAPDAINATIDELADYARHARRDAYVPFEGDDKSAWIARARLVEAGWPATADLIPYPARGTRIVAPGPLASFLRGTVGGGFDPRDHGLPFAGHPAGSLVWSTDGSGCPECKGTVTHDLGCALAGPDNEKG